MFRTRRGGIAAAGAAHEDHPAHARARTRWPRSIVYAFPGNVRELENILERAITLSTAGEMHARGHSAAPLAWRPDRRRERRPAALGDHLEDIERDAIVKRWSRPGITRRLPRRCWE